MQIRDIMNVRVLYCIFIVDVLFCFLVFFFFNDTATTEIYTLSLHDALPILSLDTSPLLSVAAVLELVDGVVTLSCVAITLLFIFCRSPCFLPTSCLCLCNVIK